MAKQSNTILALPLAVDSSWNGVISPFEWLNTSIFVVLESVFGRYPDTTFGIKEVTSLSSVALDGYPRMGHVSIYYDDRERYAEVGTGHRESRHSS